MLVAKPSFCFADKPSSIRSQASHRPCVAYSGFEKSPPAPSSRSHPSPWAASRAASKETPVPTLRNRFLRCQGRHRLTAGLERREGSPSVRNQPWRIDREMDSMHLAAKNAQRITYRALAVPPRMTSDSTTFVGRRLRAANDPCDGPELSERISNVRRAQKRPCPRTRRLDADRPLVGC